MANAYGFKDIATVDVTELVSESSHVLIEDGGVIKRAPKSQVGGAQNWDVEMEIDYYNYKSTLISGNYNDVYNKIMNGELPNIKLKVFYEYEDKETSVQKPAFISVIHNEDESDHWIKINCKTYMKNDRWITWYSDGTISL